HFRGFEAYWRIPASAPTAKTGRWVKAPGDAYFRAVKKALVGLPFIAEDLGEITPSVLALRDRFGLPGMKVLQFAFDSGPSNAYLPFHYPHYCVVYTGTHDNNTTVGWYEGLKAGQTHRFSDARKELAYLTSYLGEETDKIHRDLMRV